VVSFLEELSSRLNPKVQENYAALQAAKSRHLGASAGPIEMWDRAFYLHQAKSELFSNFGHSTPMYFTVGNCFEGLNLVANKLFGVKLVPETTSPRETWDDSVRKLAVYEENGELIGHIYCDLYSRTSKTYAAGHFAIRW